MRHSPKKEKHPLDVDTRWPCLCLCLLRKARHLRGLDTGTSGQRDLKVNQSPWDLDQKLGVLLRCPFKPPQTVGCPFSLPFKPPQNWNAGASRMKSFCLQFLSNQIGLSLPSIALEELQFSPAPDYAPPPPTFREFRVQFSKLGSTRRGTEGSTGPCIIDAPAVPPS